jgi:hypothetical protein
MVGAVVVEVATAGRRGDATTGPSCRRMRRGRMEGLTIPAAVMVVVEQAAAGGATGSLAAQEEDCRAGHGHGDDGVQRRAGSAGGPRPPPAAWHGCFRYTAWRPWLLDIYHDNLSPGRSLSTDGFGVLALRRGEGQLLGSTDYCVIMADLGWTRRATRN